MTRGPGTHLEEIIRAYLTEAPSSFMQLAAQLSVSIGDMMHCNCHDMVKIMDDWGPDKCERYRDRIIRGVFSNAMALSHSRAVTRLSEPYAAELIGQWVDEAIKRSREDS